jgi:hypothetical protein
MPTIAPLQERRARYERIMAMTKDGMDLESIGLALTPPLTRQRVQQIIDKPPRKPGPPFNPEKLAQLRSKLSLWEKRRAARQTRAQPTDVADLRIAALLAEIAFVTSNV